MKEINTLGGDIMELMEPEIINDSFIDNLTPEAERAVLDYGLESFIEEFAI